MQQSPFTQQEDVYQEAFTQLFPQDVNFETLNLSMSDDDLSKMLISSLEEDRAHWNKKPWNLEQADQQGTDFVLGYQLNEKEFLRNEVQIKDNRIFQSVRAILSYACAQLAKPDITPSKGDEVYLKGARDIGSALYQHTVDEDGEEKVKASVLNLVSRKRAYLKLRFDPNLGLNGDIVTEICNPEDIIVCRFSRFLQNPKKIYHRIQCTVDELCAKFPDKAGEIKRAFNISRGVYTQMSRMVYYFECWFTYTDSEGKPAEGVCWFIPEKKLILDKMPNPNWVYYKSKKKEKEANVMSAPPKPFITFNYFNYGHSFIDETSLVEQAIPLQEGLNKRLRQINGNADYANGRWVASKKAFSQEDARNLINKGDKTVALVDREDVSNALINVAPNQMPPWVENTIYDARNEIDGTLATPATMKGEMPKSKETLGRDLLVKQGASTVQDDLVKAVANAMKKYYKLKLQLMRVYYTDDYWFQVKGGDSKYEFILLNGNEFDTNVKISVQTDSTLPLDKPMIRAIAMELWKAGNAIDYKTLMEDLGLPNPDIRAERYLKSNLDPLNYLKSIELSQINTEAEADIQLLIANKTPDERDDYSEEYFAYFNKVLTSNRFQKLQGDDPMAAERITAFLAAIQHTVMQGLNMEESLNDAGMLPTPDPQPIPGAPMPGTTAPEATPPVPTQ